MMEEYRDFITNTLDEHGIDYREFGKNVSSKAVGVRCLYCDDTSTHMGIMTDKLNCTCWKCKESVSFARYMSDATGLPIHTFFGTQKKRPIRDLADIVNKAIAEKRKKSFIQSTVGDDLPQEVALPDGSIRINYGDDYPVLLEWQKRRKIPRKTLLKYNCYICLSGKFRNRLIVPVTYKRIIVGYVGIDLTGKMRAKTKNSSSTINNYLYNYDNIKFGGPVIVTEGILDAWAVGGVATLGTHLTARQRLLIKSKKPKFIVVLRDGDAYIKGRKNSKLSDCSEKVFHVKLPDQDDPDSLGRDKCFSLIREKMQNLK